MAVISLAQKISRDELALFLKTPRLIKQFENIIEDVSVTLPEAIDTLVQGPSGAVDENVPVFDGATGLKLKDSGVSINAVALLDSPAFTGTPTAPTPPPGDNSPRLATTEFVTAAGANAVAGPASATDSHVAVFNGATGKAIKDVGVPIASLAPLESPTFTGTPEAPTAALGTDTEQLATTAFVQDAIDNLAVGASSFSVHNNGVAQSIPNNAFTQLTFSTEVFDTGGHFASNAWTPPSGKIVMLSGAVALTGAAGAAVTVAVYKNGAEYKRGTMQMPQGTGAIVSTVSCIDSPNGTDVYTLRAFQNTGAAQNTFGGANLTYFQGTTIRA